MHWCIHSPRGLILKRYSLTDVQAASLIWLAGEAASSVSATTVSSQPESKRFVLLELTWLSHIWVCEIKEDIGGNKRACAREENADFYVKERGPMEFVILFLSHFLPKNTLPWNKWATIQCHSVSQHEIIEECNYHFAQQTFLWNEREQLGT